MLWKKGKYMNLQQNQVTPEEYREFMLKFIDKCRNKIEELHRNHWDLNLDEAQFARNQKILLTIHKSFKKIKSEFNLDLLVYKKVSSGLEELALICKLYGVVLI